MEERLESRAPVPGLVRGNITVVERFSVFGSRRAAAAPQRRSPATARRRLQAEQLERRLALAAIPTATINGPDLSALIGQEIPLTVTFDNTATNPADIGYSPFVDIVMPATGDAPPTPFDGISFKPNSATYNGLSLATTVLTFNAQGQATHPFAKNPDGTSLVVTGKPGDQLVVVQLPFGSYGPDQPAAEINFTGVVSPLAQPNSSYPVTATGGFQYQTDTAGNPTVNIATLGTTTTDPIQPQLFRIKKTSNAPEAETATGPNFQHTYTVSMAVAPGQTVTNLQLADVLPGNVQFVSLVTATGNGASTVTPVATPSTAVPGGTLTRQFDQVLGTGSESDVVMTFSYFVPQDDAAGLDVIPLGTGGTAIATNTSNATGTWTSANPNYPGPQTIASDPDDANAQHTLTARTVALQKSYADLTNPGSPRAGDLIEYTLNFQVSDYFALDNFDITDVISDGQEFDASFTPTLTYTQQSESYTAAPFAPANVTVTVNDPGNGTTDVVFDVSSQLAALRGSADGDLLGAAIPPGGTGGPLPDPLPAGPGTRGTVKFRARVLDQYRQTPRPGADVVQGDVMTDDATTTATVLAFADLNPTSSSVSDGSSQSFTLVSGNATKEIYAVNGAAPVSGTPVVTAGDEVTFRITYNLPFSSIKDYQIIDFLPLPIFAAQALTFAGGGPSATAPAAGQWSFGPTDTYAAISGITPTTSFSAAANSVTWSFGTFQDLQDRSATTDILFTVTATNRPFADGLLLTNQAEQTERNETGNLLTSNTALAQVQISEPLLDITKGVVSTTNTAGVFTPPTVAPAGVTFSQPGQPGAAFTGTVTSSGLATTPIDSNLSNVLGSDLVKFAIVVENTGSGVNGAFDVAFRDVFDATRMRIPTSGTGLNLQVTDGTGAALAYTGDLFGGGITLVDPSASTGSLDPGKTTGGTVINTGANIAIITYDLELLPTVVPNDVIPNTATLTNYASTEGGPNFLSGGLTDDATVTVQSPTVTKSLVSTSIVDSFNSNTQGVIGELATFELTVDFPRGTTPSAVVVDSLPTGLAFVRMVGTPVVDPGVTFTDSAAPAVTNSGRTVTFSLGDVTNANAGTALQGITFRYEAVVLNVSSNVAGKTLANSAKLTWTGHTDLPAAQSGPVTVIEPKLTIDKSVTPTTAQASDVVTFTILVTASQTTAHNVSLSDIFPGDITYVDGSLQHTAGVAPTTLATAGGGNSFTATYTQLTPGQTSTLTFQARINATVIAGRPITNTATETWTSLPGNPGQITPNNPNAYERTGSGSTAQGQLNNYGSSDSATVTVAQPTVAKALVTTSIVNASNSATEAVIGETATYTVRMTIPQGRTPAAQLIDAMGSGMAYVRTITAVNDDPTKLTVPGLNSAPVLTNSGSTATWNLGDIVNTDTDSSTDETITFTIETVVLNVNTNTSGVRLVNKAQAGWNLASFSPIVEAEPVEVIEPKLRTTKAVAVGGLGGNVGDPVTYTIVVRQSGTSDTDAFGVTLRDAIPASIASPVLTSVVDTSGVVTAANFALSGNTLTTTGTGFDLPKEPTTRTITLTVSGTLAGPVTANQRITNTNQIKWSSLSGSPGQITPNNPNAYERTGSGSTSQGQLNNYVTTGSASFTVNTADLAVSKTVSDPTPNVGDTITFVVTLSNLGPNTATEVEVTDQFPTTGLQLLTSTPSQGTYDPGTGIWDVGTVATGAGNAKTLTITARVLAPAVNTIPLAQTNVATVTSSAEPDPNPGNNTGSATETPKYADLGVKKTTDNVQPGVGETVTYTVSLFNLGTSAATNVEVTDTLPANVTFVSATPSAGTFDTTNKVWSIPNVPTTNGIANPLTLTIVATATSTGRSFNTVTITASDVWDPNDRNNTAKTPTDPQEADLVVSKTVDDSTPNVGDNVTFTVTLNNLGPSASQNVVVNDLLPAGLTYVSHVASSGTYVPGTGVWTLATVPASTTDTLTVVATVATPASGPALPLTNTATATSTTPDPNPDNNTDDKTVTPLQADLAVIKVVDNPNPNVGDTITFTVEVDNFGPDAATQVVVNDILPAGLTFVSASPSTGAYAGGVWTVGAVAAGGSATLTVTATVDAPASPGIPQPVTNTASVSGREYDPDPSNNTDSVTETPQYADLAVTKVVNDATPNVGDTITFTITLSNLGADTATNVTVLDQLPSGLQFVSATANEGTYDPGTGIWTVGTVDTLFARTLQIDALVLPPVSGVPQPSTNTASVNSSDQYDPDPSNNTDSVTETPQYADLAVEKVVSNSNPNVGGQVTFTVTLRNLGIDEATGVTIADPLPSGLTFVSASPSAGTNYSPATGVWQVGAIPAGGEKTLAIVVAVPGPGSFTNVATVATTDQFDPDHTNDRGESTISTREADLAVAKTVNDPTPNVGDTITFTVTVSNLGPDSANNVQITDSFPVAGLQLLSAVPSQGTFNAGTGVWTVGTVDVGIAAAKTLLITARVLAPAVNTVPSSQTNVATVTAADEFDPNPGNNTGTATETPLSADLGVKKTTSNVQPNVGETVTYTVSLFNLGTAVATNVEVTDALPANVSFLSATPAAGTRFDETPTGGVWSVPSIAPGQTLVLTLTVEAVNTSVAFNTATITHSDVWDPNNRNNTARTPTDPQEADLIVSKTVNDTAPNVGDNVTFTITLENVGPSTAQSVAVADLLPAGLQFVSATPSAGSYSAGSGVWTLGSVPAATTNTLLVVATVLAPSSGPAQALTNTATATSTTPDPNPDNNTDQSTLTPQSANLAVFKTVDNAEPSIGELVTFEIVVANYGPDTATLVTVNDPLPSGLEFVSASASQGAYVAGTGVWTVGTVTTADTPTLSITAKVIRRTGGTETNTATVSGREYDPDPSNNTDSVDVEVQSSGVIVGTDIGCITGPFVRVIDPDTGADRIIPFFAYEPRFRGGVRVYGADVTGDGIPEILTAPGPGRPGEVRVFSETGVPLPQYNFFPFGRGYTGGIEIAAGSVTAAGTTQIVAGQSRGGTVRVFNVTPGAASPVASSPIRQLQPYGAAFRGGVTVAMADLGTFAGSTRTSPTPDGITELVTGSGPGMPATVKVYNGVPARPALINAFRAIAPGYARGVAVSRLPTTAGVADKIMVSAGSGGGGLVETYSGLSRTREASFRAFGGTRAAIFAAAVSEAEIFTVEGEFGRTNGVRKNTSTSGAGGALLPQSTVAYPPLRVAILRR
jgi:uncharacterized repeat protein (TIGR01451 family)/fimbrial isopeptide formation D2 family protein